MSIATFQPIINLSGGACTCIGTAASGSSQVGYASAPDWGCVLQTIQNGLNDVVLLATVLITIYIAWAGITYMTSATSSEARSKARQRIWNAIIGLLIVLCAWLLIDSLMKVIYNQSASLNGVPGAQLGPWNQILSAPASADCLKVNITIPPLPGLGVGNPVVANQNAGGGVQSVPQSTAPPSTSCGQNTHLNCAAAVAWLQSNITSLNQYGHACLHDIRQALSAGGVSLSCGAPPGHTEYAGYCDQPLAALGFTSLGSSDSNPQPADILVIQDSAGKQIGHITMWTGSVWISDTIQSGGESPPGNPYGSSGYNPQYWRP